KTTFKVQDSVPKNRIVEEEEEEPAEPQSQNTDVSLRESSSNTYVYLGLGVVILISLFYFSKNIIKVKPVVKEIMTLSRIKSSEQSSSLEPVKPVVKEKKCSIPLME
ncbi:hypothetical protein, partial [Bartonella sp. CL45QHWL]|uniref:hypothetical protein n=1 Tax=Bartonella sp. CL45QHWL TaxID=3243533 RepID=UPI0035CEA46C